jgi:hypothetical protein
VVSKLTPQQQEVAFADIFQIYGAAGNVKLIQELSNIAKYEKELMNDANDTSNYLATAINSSPLAKLMKVGNALMEKGFAVLDEYADSGSNGLDTLLKRVSSFDMKPVISAITTTGKAMWTMYKITEPFIPMLPYLIGGFGAFKAVMAGFAAIKFVAAFTELAWGVALMEGVLAGGGLAAGLWAVAAPLAVIGANLVIWREVAKSLNGQDNFISKGAQALGLVPKLATDERGNVIGRSSEQYAWTPWDAGDVTTQAPNATDAKARAQQSWKGYLQFGNMPEGSTINNQPVRGNVWEFGNMGVNKP